MCLYMQQGCIHSFGKSDGQIDPTLCEVMISRRADVALGSLAKNEAGHLRRFFRSRFRRDMKTVRSCPIGDSAPASSSARK
jgi:hypothetical protein